MPTFRQKFVAFFTRLYPFYSGCAQLANNRYVKKLAGRKQENVWASVPGGEILTPLDDYVGRAAFYVGDLDRKLTWICEKIVRPGDTVLDIGANVGLVTVWLSKLVGKDGIVHAFEPNPNLITLLQQTITRNQLFNIKLHKVALGNVEGTLELTVPPGNAGKGSFIRNSEIENCKKLKVKILQLSNIIQAESIKSIRLIKIDVEGFEREVLLGAQEMIKSIRPDTFIFELNERTTTNVIDEPVINILYNLNYKFFSIPECYLKMNLKTLNPLTAKELIGTDILAVKDGNTYNEIIKLLNVK